MRLTMGRCACRKIGKRYGDGTDTAWVGLCASAFVFSFSVPELSWIATFSRFLSFTSFTATFFGDAEAFALFVTPEAIAILLALCDTEPETFILVFLSVALLPTASFFLGTDAIRVNYVHYIGKIL